MINRYFIQLAFDGTNFKGWQQQNKVLTVQNTINAAISTILKEEINVTGCGRTDAGVHAHHFFAHFDTRKLLDHQIRIDLTKRLNGYLSYDIALQEIIPVMNEAHARFDALSRTYKYYISRVKDPFIVKYSYDFREKLNIGLMNKGAGLIRQYKDFTSFSKVNTQTKTNICKISEAYWEETADVLVFTITADRFLRNMVRAIVGTLLDIGRGKTKLSDLATIIESRDRSNAGPSVPAQGLFLHEVQYPTDIFKSVT